MEDTKRYLINAVQVTLAVIVLLVVSTSLESLSDNHQGSNAKSFLSQSGKWYRMSLQDRDPFYALQHCDYALAYLNAARHTANDNVLERTGTDIHRYHNKLLEQQNRLMKTLLPKITGKKSKTPPAVHASWIT